MVKNWFLIGFLDWIFFSWRSMEFNLDYITKLSLFMQFLPVTVIIIGGYSISKSRNLEKKEKIRGC